MEEQFYKIKEPITIEKAAPDSKELAKMMEDLSSELEIITGSSGKNSFSIEDVSVPRAICLIAKDSCGTAVGCVALRPMTTNVAEIKRMYAKKNDIRLGKQILSFLEQAAKDLDYKFIRLETRLVNKRAVEFYKRNDYYKISNYGKYKERQDVICFEKKL